MQNILWKCKFFFDDGFRVAAGRPDPRHFIPPGECLRHEETGRGAMKNRPGLPRVQCHSETSGSCRTQDGYNSHFVLLERILTRALLLRYEVEIKIIVRMMKKKLYQMFFFACEVQWERSKRRQRYLCLECRRSYYWHNNKRRCQGRFSWFKQWIEEGYSVRKLSEIHRVSQSTMRRVISHWLEQTPAWPHPILKWTFQYRCRRKLSPQPLRP